MKHPDYKYNIRREILINKVQYNSLKILDDYGVNVSQFIRSAIKEKLQKDWKEIKLTKNIKCPF